MYFSVPGPRDVSSWNLNFFMILLIIVFVILMYALRPQSLRHLNNDIAKDRNNERVSSLIQIDLINLYIFLFLSYRYEIYFNFHTFFLGFA